MNEREQYMAADPEMYRDELREERGMNKHLVLGELSQLRFDIKGFEDMLREGNHDKTVNELQVILKDFASRVAKVQEHLMDDAPAHDHLKDDLFSDDPIQSGRTDRT